MTTTVTHCRCDEVCPVHKYEFADFVRMAAAAPQMLEALEACLEWEESYRTINNLGLEPPYPFEQAKAAIRSAKGEL